MLKNEDKIKNIENKVSALADYLKYCTQQIDILKQELNQLKQEERQTSTAKIEQAQNIVSETPAIASQSTKNEKTAIYSTIKQFKKTNLEEYIGGNLIAKIGIITLVIGLAFGVRYAVDANLINPLTRIVLAFLFGATLLFVAFKLRLKYELFSAILLSGAMASLYLTAYAGFAWYNLYPYLVAFVLMLIFTAFTVFSATIYNNQWIALFGLVGAYSIPFLISNNSENIILYFSYVALINIGIVVLSFKRYWIWLSHSAFALTIIIFFTWFNTAYNQANHLFSALVFSSINFITFYISFLAYKVVKKEAFSWRDILLVFFNNIYFFSIGIAIISPINSGIYTGLFASLNALLHFIIAYYLHKKADIDKKVFYLLLSFVIAFLTIAIPLQLEGVWVTLFLSIELIVLIYIGFTKQISFYKWLAIALTCIAFFSLIEDYSHVYLYPYAAPFENNFHIPFLNLTFFSSILYIVAISLFLYYLYYYKNSIENNFKGLNLATAALIPLLIITTYLSVYLEISDAFFAWQAKTALEIPINISTDNIITNYNYDESIIDFKTIWITNFSFVYAGIFTWFVLNKTKNNLFLYLSMLIWLFTLIFGFTTVFTAFQKLISYKTEQYNSAIQYSNWNVFIRYVSYPFLLLALHSFNGYIKHTLNKKVLKNIFKSLFAIYLLLVLTTEIICLAETYEIAKETYNSMLRKFAVTLLWGAYSFILIFYGIKKKSKILRITAIGILTITLLKLFVNDIQILSKGFRIAAFLALGILLLVVSFLYQKFARVIFANDENTE